MLIKFLWTCLKLQEPNGNIKITEIYRVQTCELINTGKIGAIKKLIFILFIYYDQTLTVKKPN